MANCRSRDVARENRCGVIRLTLLRGLDDLTWSALGMSPELLQHHTNPNFEVNSGMYWFIAKPGVCNSISLVFWKSRHITHLSLTELFDQDQIWHTWWTTDGLRKIPISAENHRFKRNKSYSLDPILQSPNPRFPPTRDDRHAVSNVWQLSLKPQQVRITTMSLSSANKSDLMMLRDFLHQNPHKK